MTPAMRDRIMSLHRRAYDCKSLEQWWELASTLDCPVDARDQFWKTAQEAKKAGMDKKQAFPLAGEVFKELALDCIPGDLVWFRNLLGEIVEAELVEWDNGTAIVKNKKGEQAVRCV
jgi:hypothetical protein